jgi:predicted Zn-ribbon and HTH transcriptional regulator
MNNQIFHGFSNIGFDFIPPLDTTISNRNQVLTLLDYEEVEHKVTGARMTLLVWSSKCAECGEPYIFRSSWAKPRIARRCAAHSVWNKRCFVTYPPDAIDPKSLF